MNKMIAYCGLNCEKCDAYLATINDDNELREKTAKLWSTYNAVKIEPKMINCTGCRVDGVKTVFCGTLCEIRKCAKNKNFETCGNCLNMENCKTVEQVHINNKDALNNLKH